MTEQHNTAPSNTAPSPEPSKSANWWMARNGLEKAFIVAATIAAGIVLGLGVSLGVVAGMAQLDQSGGRAAETADEGNTDDAGVPEDAPDPTVPPTEQPEPTDPPEVLRDFPVAEAAAEVHRQAGINAQQDCQDLVDGYGPVDDDPRIQEKLAERAVPVEEYNRLGDELSGS